jgi:hypothetical protein
MCNANDNLPVNEKSDSNKILNSSFPFEKEKYYEQGFIRKRIGHPQWGISHNKEGNYWVVIKNKNNTNIYDDRIGKDGLYRYTGQGLSGDQSYDNANNFGLKNAELNGQKIHLFWQDNQNSNHKYIGIVKVVKADNSGEKQRGQDGYPRTVIVFTLEPVD